MKYEFQPIDEWRKQRMDRAEKRVIHTNARPFTIHSRGKVRVIRRNDLDDMYTIMLGSLVGILVAAYILL